MEKEYNNPTAPAVSYQNKFPGNNNNYLQSNIQHLSGPPWTPEEHALFIEGIKKYGHHDLNLVAQHIKTRTVQQVQNYLQRTIAKIQEQKRQQAAQQQQFQQQQAPQQ